MNRPAATQQLSMFDMLEPAPEPIRYPVDPQGHVIQGEPDETLTLPHPRLAWALARIELHRHTDGLWMWSASRAGGGHKVGPKWGKFARTREAALHFAAMEIIEWHGKLRDPAPAGITPVQARQILKWAQSHLMVREAAS